ncbi:MAG: biopolymer transporter ExbD, partial [Burkholderiaceae bacterium]
PMLAIETRLSGQLQRTPQPPVQIRGDKTTPYSMVNEIVKIAQAQGMAKVGFVTTPPKKGQ